MLIILEKFYYIIENLKKKLFSFIQIILQITLSKYKKRYNQNIIDL